MHLRNSCTRSASSCCIVQVPSALSGLPRLERLDLLLHLVVPRHVGDEVLDARERLHRLDDDRLVGVEVARAASCT